MALWRRIGGAGFERLIYRGKRWYSILPGSGAPAVVGVVRLRGFRVLEGLFPGGCPMYCYSHFRSYVALGQDKPKTEGKGGDWRKPKLENDGGIRINEAIDEREVRLVTDQGHRIVSIKEALYLAKQLDLDLVEVQRKIKIEGGTQSPAFKPAVCKLMDYCKEKYKQDVKGKERAKTKSAIALRNGENKEVRFKAKTELKDLKIKAESVKRLMERGYRVKCTAMPTGKDGEDLGGLLLNLLSQIEDISVVESGPHLDTKNAYVIVKHIKFASKKGKKLSSAVETVSSVLSTRSSAAAADNNSASKDEDDCQNQEEEWEAVESDSETEFDGPSKQVGTNAQNLSGLHPTSPPKVVSRGFGEVTDWSASNATNDVKAEITFTTKHTSPSGTMSASKESINKESRRNAAGFQPSQPEPYLTESNRYSRGTNSTSHQIRPTNRDHSFPPKVAVGTQRKTPEQSNRIEGLGLSNRNDRPAHNHYPNSSSSRHAVFSASQSSGPNERSKPGDEIMGNNPSAPKLPQQRYGVFSSTKSSSPVDEKRMRDISTDRLNKSSPPTSNYGIFSSPKTISSDDQMKQRDATRDNSIRLTPGYGDTSKSSNASPSSPRFGIFTSSKKTSSGEGRAGDKN